jgi:hypothetical protein
MDSFGSGGASVTRQEMWKQFIEAVEQKGRPATAAEIPAELYGGDPDVQQASAVNIANECKQADLLLVSVDYQDIRLTPKGRAFIGK